MPIWLKVLLCGVVTQLVKLLAYSVAQRRLALPVLGESVGLPSLHAAVFTCLTVLMGIALGWGATETALALVLTVIVIYDAIRLKSESQAQRITLHWLVQNLPQANRWQRQVSKLLNVRGHQPFQVAIGVLFGLLFALALA